MCSITASSKTIESFDLGGEPLSAVLVFETSSRIAPLLPAVQKSGDCVYADGHRPVGRCRGPRLQRPCRTAAAFHRGSRQDRENDRKPSSQHQRHASCTTALSTAVGLLRDRPASRRRVIIVVGEARDAGSEERLGEVLREAQLSNIVIYAVGLSTTAAELRSPPQAIRASPGHAARHVRDAADPRAP